ncbi:hypothetical protein LXA43DRAFT_155427 [Ganoderma leucocontextum]|nr:hypothetical protein LXA43DRAFT_155427 [Ganoderma leucocontextum]
MFHFRRSDAPPDQPEKPTARPRSLSSQTPSTSSTASSANAPPLPRRAPLAPLQSTNAPLAADDPMSSSSSFLGYSPDDNSQETDPARFGIGRPIVPRTTADSLNGNPASSSRRRSIPNQAQSSSTVSRPPLLQPLRPLPRRPNHTPSSSTSSSRRGSLPNVLHQPTAKAAPSQPPLPLPNDNANLATPSDDIYSNLSTFTFGAARSPPPRRTDQLISPFTVPTSNSADRTPRQSVSSGRRRSTPRIITNDVEGRSRSDDDEEEAARQNRAKMRAIDDGTRRPSLPVNAYSGSSGSVSPPRPDMDSEAEPDSATVYDDSEDLDTDVEFDYRHVSREDISDAASLHTFGGGDKSYYAPGPARDDRYSRLSFTTSIMTQDQDEDEDEEEDGDHIFPGASSPVTFARMRDSGGEESTPSSIGSPALSRRGSTPWAIPAPPSSVPRDREDSEVTILAARRMSRSLDDDLGQQHPPLPPHVQATSQPTTLADWRTLEAQVQAQMEAQVEVQMEEQMEEQVQIDPDEQIRVDDAPPEAEAVIPDTYEGFNLQYILGDGTRRSWSSGAPSYIAPGGLESRRTSIAPWEYSNSISSGRRSSTTTMSDDAFTSQLRKLDKGYLRRREEWSFRKEMADGSTNTPIPPRPGRPAIHELWRHQYVGRFKVDKQWTEHPSKAPTQRINVRHITDPFSRGNTKGGPHSIIHRHSRAVAFSIFRKYGLFGRSHKPGGTSFHVHTSGTILLATMDVQAQFTSTRTTSQLNAHGLLTDGQSRPVDRESNGRERSKDKERDRDRAKEKLKTKEKGKPGRKVGGVSDTSSQTTSSGSAASGSAILPATPMAIKTAVGNDGTLRRRQYGSSPPSVPTSPTIVAPSAASTSYAASISAASLSSQTVDTRSPVPSIDITTPPRDRLPSSLNRNKREEGMELDDDETLIYPKTSHAEAFATLDSGSIEYLRGRSEHHVEHEHSGGGGLMERLARRIRGNNVRIAGKQSTPSPDVPFTPTLPPWVTLAPRSKQEERERVIQNLNESFKDVGLLPTFRNNRNERSKGKQPMKNTSGVNVFEEVPLDALHMLLPLWPCNTDESSTILGEDEAKFILSVEERQYLIVYYVPFDERRDKKKKGEANKKRSRSDSLATSTAASPKMKGIPKSAFRVCARLVCYHDFLGTGVRLPSEGLAITGQMAAAMAELPPASIREKHPGDVVIGVCSGKERDIEFIPEGLACVGLAIAVEENPPPQPPSPVHEEEMMDDFDPVYTLTPIGRAAVEMAWLGCLAITFSDVLPLR